jgi:hypothetical protein
MLHVWRGRERTALEKLPLALASYNCGAGCVINAQKKANDARDFEEISIFLPTEAAEYPIRIQSHWFKMMCGE